MVAAMRSLGRRYYGDGNTIHGTLHLDVEVRRGEVVAVWFRCQPLPFKQRDVDVQRAIGMKQMYEGTKTELHGVDVKP